MRGERDSINRNLHRILERVRSTMEELGTWGEGGSLYVMWYTEQLSTTVGSHNDEMWTGSYR